jgi:hypothetical protein
MDVRHIQHSATVGNLITIVVNGEKYSGILEEIAVDHITLRTMDDDGLSVWSPAVIDAVLPYRRQETPAAPPAPAQPVYHGEHVPPPSPRSEPATSPPSEMSRSVEHVPATSSGANGGTSKDGARPAEPAVHPPPTFTAPHTPQSPAPWPSPSGSVDAQVATIVTFYRSAIEQSQLYPQLPTWEMDEQNLAALGYRQRRDVQNRWSTIRNQYAYAVKVREPSRYSRIIHELEDLQSTYASLPEISFNLGAIYLASGDLPNGLRLSDVASRHTQNHLAYFNVAVAALAMDEFDQCYIALREHFKRVSPRRLPNAWYIALRLSIAKCQPDLITTVLERTARLQQRDSLRSVIEGCVFYCVETGQAQAGRTIAAILEHADLTISEEMVRSIVGMLPNDGSVETLNRSVEEIASAHERAAGTRAETPAAWVVSTTNSSPGRQYSHSIPAVHVPTYTARTRTPTGSNGTRGSVDLRRLIREAQRDNALSTIKQVREHTLAPSFVQPGEHEKADLTKALVNLTLEVVEAHRFSNPEKAQACKYTGDTLRRLKSWHDAAKVYHALSGVASDVQERANGWGLEAECLLKAGTPAEATTLLLKAMPAQPENRTRRSDLVRAVRQLMVAGESAALIDEVSAAYPDVVQEASQSATHSAPVLDNDLADDRYGGENLPTDDSTNPDMPNASVYVQFIVERARWPQSVLENAGQQDSETARQCWEEGERYRREATPERQNSTIDPQAYENAALWFGAAARIYLNLLQSGGSAKEFALERSNAWCSYLGALGPYYLAKAFGAAKAAEPDGREVQEAADAAADMFAEALLLSMSADRAAGKPVRRVLRRFFVANALKANLLASIGSSIKYEFDLSLRGRWDLKRIDHQMIERWRSDGGGSATAALAHLGFRCGPTYLDGIIGRDFKLRASDLLGTEFASLNRAHNDFVTACAAIQATRSFEAITRLDHETAILRQSRHVLRWTDARRVDILVGLLQGARGLQGLRPQTTLELTRRFREEVDELIKSFETAPTLDGVANLKPACMSFAEMIDRKRSELMAAFHAELGVEAHGVERITSDRVAFQIRIVNRGAAAAETLRLVWDSPPPLAISPPAVGPYLAEAQVGTQPGIIDADFTVTGIGTGDSAHTLECRLEYEEHAGAQRRVDTRFAELNFAPPAPVDRGVSPYDPRRTEGIEPPAVHGRENEIKELLRWTVDPDKYRSQKIVVGLARAGKTSVLRRWAFKLWGEAVQGRPVLPVRVMAAQTARNPLNLLAVKIIDNIRDLQKPDADWQIYCPGAGRPTVESALAVAAQFPFDSACTNEGPDRVAWDWLLPRMADRGLWTVLMLDEFDAFWSTHHAALGDGFFSELRELSVSWGSVAYCGLWRLHDMIFDPRSRVRMPERTDTTRRTVKIPPLDSEGVREIIYDDHGGRRWWTDFEDSALDRVVELTGGEPALVALLCQQLWMTAERCVITRAAIERIIPQVLANGRDLIKPGATQISVVPGEQHLAMVLLGALADVQYAAGGGFDGATMVELLDHCRARHGLRREVGERMMQRVLQKMVERTWLAEVPLKSVPHYRVRADLAVEFLSRDEEARSAVEDAARILLDQGDDDDPAESGE